MNPHSEFKNPSPEEIAERLKTAQTIAVVGLSPKTHRDSFRIAQFLQNQGYQVIPVNPRYSEVLGERCYPNLEAIDRPLDLVNVFRRLEKIPQIIEEAITIQAPWVWTQFGLWHPESALKAEKAGVRVVMDRCIKVDYLQLGVVREHP